MPSVVVWWTYHVTDWVAGWIEELSSAQGEKMPQCPFARKAWQADEVKVIESQELWKAVYDEVCGFGEHKVVLCIQPVPEQEYTELEAACNALNHWFSSEQRDIWLLSSERNGSSIVFIQKLSELELASRSLEKLGYYSEYSAEDFERLIDMRRRLNKAK